MSAWAWAVPAIVLAGLGLTAGGRCWWATIGLILASRRVEREVARTVRAIDRRLGTGEGGPGCSC